MPNSSISEIEPGLYLGDQNSSYNIPTLAASGITAMVSLSDAKSVVWRFPPNRKLVPESNHLFIPCLDTSTQDPLARLPEVCEFIDEKRSGETVNSNVLVHCTAGVSRSATVVIAYLMRKYRKSLDSALESVARSRKVRPNPNFMDQLAVWGEVEYELWADVAKTVPKPPYAAYLARRAEKLKAKGLTGNEPTCPDL
ncbi:protein-tyrosine phosphatase-like protein [Hypomontagnella monticulosa]|nr:protein-tyrosine phosphatase-like protein [Hypomontagnella monticulosa]